MKVIINTDYVHLPESTREPDTIWETLLFTYQQSFGSLF